MSINHHLIGDQQAARGLATPVLILDLDAFQRNVAKMAAHCREHGIALRPHAKTHKSVTVAKAQIAAGAIGICCAKVGEAEALGAGGVGGILITSPVVARQALARLAALNLTSSGLIVVVDHAESAAALSAAALATGKPIDVLVDIDPGMGRSGVQPGAAALALAATIAPLAGLRLVGIQCYDGDVQHVAVFNDRKARSLAAMTVLAHARDAFRQAGFATGVLSGGGTGTFDIDPPAGALTELQAGSYVFMDRQYNEIAHAGQGPPFETALFVETTVISANRPGRVTTDAGLKAFATDDGAPLIRTPGIRGDYTFVGDEQGSVRFQGDAQLGLGDTVRLVTPHCDPTVNLYDAYHVMRGETLVDIWPIEARGRSY
ncbi:MAG: DSD1 family PLP-dependent enzyme [Phenylobacterium sp.]|uniref:DSD1 family PLP-dependent enzyme n=1 Tax=Phenylobacterium sp. TaxID=1871053 RepID=UPI0011F9531E|nr:DSD1 family PLP-dependent enzyme [Phenylobacterium sp.]TAJ73898.1 MAG: DSD1 family PLP-dependent enzyme [Phenylobacterium sp.]